MDLSNVNWGRFVLAVVAALVLLMAGDFLIHVMILMEPYEAHYAFARPAEEMPILPAMLVDVVWAVLLVWIYTFGIHPGKPGWLQGLRFGVLMGLFWWLPYGLLQYSILPIPAFFIWAWTGLCTVQMAVAGLAVGLIYKTKAQSLLGAME